MRLHGLDIARFLAFAGMVLVNFRIVAGPPDGTDFGTLITHGLEGRAAALFVVLAGVGVTLSRAPALLLLKRAAFLFVIGMANMLIFDADILHFYALYFVVAAGFIASPGRHLLAAAAGVTAIALLALFLLDYDRGWDWDSYSYADFWTPAGFLRHSLFNGWHPVFPWAAFLLVGMWLGRKPLGDRHVQLAMLLGGVILSVLASLPGRVPSDPDLKAVLGTAPIPPGPFYVLAGIGSSAAMIGAVLLLAAHLQRLGIADWFAAPGRQSLTLYVAHIMLGMGVMDAMGWMNGALSSPQVFWGSLAFCALSSLYARIWGLFFKRGPLENLMRLLTEPRIAQKGPD